MEKPRRSERRTARRAVAIFLQLALTVVVTVFLVRRVGVGIDDVRALDARWWRPDASMLLLASAVLFAGYVVSAVLWAKMAADFGGARLSPARSTSLFMTANLGRYVPGKVWQILGLVYLSRAEGIPGATAGAAAALGQLFALGGAAVVGVGVLSGSETYAWVALASVASLLVISLAWAWRPLRDAAVGLLARWTEVERGEFEVGSRFGLRWALLYTLNWGIYAASFWLFVRCFQPSVAFTATGPPFAAAYLLGYLFLPAPAGLGVREGFLVAFLAPTLGAGSLAIAVTARLWMTVVELLPALLMAPGQLRRSYGPSAANPSGERPESNR